MGMMGMFKWLRKDIVHRDRNNRFSLSPKRAPVFESDAAYRSALQAFLDRRSTLSTNTLNRRKSEPSAKHNQSILSYRKNPEDDQIDKVPGVPCLDANELFEIALVPGAQNTYIELIFAEWQSTRVTLKRSIRKGHRDAIKNDIQVLTEIRHPHVFLLMATSQTIQHGLMAIFESVSCTLYNYIHNQEEQISVQGIARCSGKLADALRHAHSRGFVHGAINSHCVYFTSCGTIKIGGWELATSKDTNIKSNREYEDSLRNEFFRWQAPEIFEGLIPTCASDVYGLSVLIWEMSTMIVPWQDMTKAEVVQCLQWNQGINTDLHNFPVLLKNLLKDGLNLIPCKRTLDMNRMHRYLQRLEIQYEKEDAIYVEPFNNNNNIAVKPAKNNMGSQRIAEKTFTETPRSSRKPFASEKFLNRDDCVEKAVKKIDLFNSKVESGERADWLAVKATKVPMVHEKKESQAYQGAAQDVNLENGFLGTDNREPVWMRESSIRSKESEFQSLHNSNTSSVSTSWTANSEICEDDGITESSSDAHLNIERLKDTLARKRMQFFYGKEESQDTPEEPRQKQTESAIMQVRSRDYEPHKPASHKTSFEPKLNKSMNQGDFSFTKSESSHQQSYSQMPMELKDAVLQKQVLNTDVKSFFASSLWNKEQQICMSKMAKDGCLRDKVSVKMESPTKILINMQTINNQSTDNNQTYVVNNNIQDETTSVNDITPDSIEPDGSLQVLKDALNRATDLLTSPSSVTDDQSSLSPTHPKAEQYPLDNATEDSTQNEKKFEDDFAAEMRKLIPRRRSLPAALSQLGSNSASLRKLHIRKSELPDNTPEDLYIDDDEFNDSLNINMVLLEDDI